MNILTLIAGIGVLFLALLDAFQTVILPRRAMGRFRITSIFYIVTWAPWSWLATRIKLERKRETMLSFLRPLSLVLLIVIWAGALVLGFALIFYGLGSPLRSLWANSRIPVRYLCKWDHAIHTGSRRCGATPLHYSRSGDSGSGNGAGFCCHGNRLFSSAVWSVFAAGSQYFAA